MMTASYRHDLEIGAMYREKVRLLFNMIAKLRAESTGEWHHYVDE
jgi:hypothetical protein